jgi:sugar fermentation stimulation protein A
VETKSATLVVDGTALFPDAPTTRGVRHLNSLAQAAALGHRAAVVFVVQRGDAAAFSPHDIADPEFGKALRRCVGAGVEALAYCCEVSEQEVRLAWPALMKL